MISSIPLSPRGFRFQSNKEVKIKENLTEKGADSEFGVNQNHLDSYVTLLTYS